MVGELRGVARRVRASAHKDVSAGKRAVILIGFCLAQILDVITTHIGLASGRRELNGIAAWIIAHNGELAVYAVKLTLVAGLVGFVLFYGRRRTSIWNAYLIAAWITAFAVINNLYRILS
jgi:uncharacterized protein DUF5658